MVHVWHAPAQACVQPWPGCLLLPGVLCGYPGLVALGTSVWPALKLSLALHMGGVQMPRH